MLSVMLNWLFLLIEDLSWKYSKRTHKNRVSGVIGVLMLALIVADISILT